MDKIQRAKSISIWVFIIPFLAVNTCLVLITQFHELFPNKEDIVWNSLWPYLDGGLSISRTARPFPSWLVFKPAMFLTSFLLIKYWYLNRDIILNFNKDKLHSVRSCNIGFYKKDCIAVNGFNNKFEGWGREDSEFILRLLNKGLKRKNVRFNLIQYHLWHNESSREHLEKNTVMLDKAINNHSNWCDDGIDKYL